MRLNFVTNHHAHFTRRGNDQNAVPAVAEDLRHSQEVARIYLKVSKTFVLKKLFVWYHVMNKNVLHGLNGPNMVIQRVPCPLLEECSRREECLDNL